MASDIELRIKRRQQRILTEYSDQLLGATKEQAEWIEHQARMVAWIQVKEDLETERKQRDEARVWRGFWRGL